MIRGDDENDEDGLPVLSLLVRMCSWVWVFSRAGGRERGGGRGGHGANLASIGRSFNNKESQHDAYRYSSLHLLRYFFLCVLAYLGVERLQPTTTADQYR